MLYECGRFFFVGFTGGRVRSARVGSGRVRSIIDFLQTLICKHASRFKTETKTETARNARMWEQGIAVVEKATHPREARSASLRPAESKTR